MFKKYLPVLVLLVLFGGLIFLKTGKIKNFFIKKQSLISIQEDRLIKIEILKDKKKTILEKKAGQWVIKTENNFPAKTEGLKDFFKKAKELTNPQIVSVNPKKHKIYEVDEKNGLKVILKEKGGKTQELIMGKIAPSGYEFYLRVDKGNNVYLADLDLKNFFDNVDFKDLTILKLDTQKIKKITFKKGQEEFSLERKREKDKKEVKWFIDNKEADQNRVSDFLTNISTLTAKDGSIQEVKGIGLESPRFSLIIESENQPKAEFLVGNQVSFEENPDYYCHLKGSSIIFTISSTTFSDLNKEKNDFLSP